MKVSGKGIKKAGRFLEQAGSFKSSTLKSVDFMRFSDDRTLKTSQSIIALFRSFYLKKPVQSGSIARADRERS